MRNVLKYYYNLTFDDIEEHDDYAILRIMEDIYIFKKFIQDEEETKYISSLLIKNQIPVHLMVYNKENSLYTLFEKEKYVLIKLQNIAIEIDNDFIMIPTSANIVDVAGLWSKKIDYYMQQIRELGLGKEILINAFNYYIGMAENAISLYNRSMKLSGEVGYAISHRRIYYPNYSINYNDPTNMLIDIRIRDIAEYSKSRFFKSDFCVDNLIDMVYKYNLNNKEVNFLYARLFYPTYFFDIFEDAIISKKDSNDVLKILDKRKKYEEFLYAFYIKLKDKFDIFEINWIKNRTC